MDISELNLTEVEYNDNFCSANEVCRDPIVLTTDEQTRYLAVLGYKQSDQNNATNAYIVVWDVTTKKSVVRIETNSNILNIFASPKSRDLFCLSKNRFSFLYPLKEYEPIPLQGVGPTSTANFQKIRKLQREECELHEWVWDPSDPPMTSSEEICLNSSHGKQYTIDLLSVKKNDIDEKQKQKEHIRQLTWTCHISNCGTLNANGLDECASCHMPRPKNRIMNNGSILETTNEELGSIGPIPDLILKTTVVENGTVVHLIGQFVSDINHSSIIIVDADSGAVIDKVIFNGFHSPTSVVTEKFEVSQNRLLLRKFNSNRVAQLDIFQANASEIIFFDLESRCEITSYKAVDLCCSPKNRCPHGKEPVANGSWAQAEKACNYIAKFDVNPRRKQFLIYSQNLTLYQLMEYNDDENISPQVLVVGSTYLYELTERTFNNVLLSNGILFSAPIFESYPRMSKEYQSFRDSAALAVFAINLLQDQKTTKCPIISVMEDKNGLESALMNECSTRIFWDKKDKRDANFAGISKFTQRFLHLVDDYTLTVSIGNATYLHIDMCLSGKEVAEREATQLYKNQIMKEKSERERIKREAEIQRVEKEKEAKRKLKDKERVEVIDKLRKKYVDKEDSSEFVLQGKIHTWKKSYGFVRAKGEAKDLGNIFVHITDVKNKKKGKYPNRNKWIQFYAKYDPKQSSLRATDVILIDKPLVNDNSDIVSSSSKLNGKVENGKLSISSKAPGKASSRDDSVPTSSKRRFHKLKNKKKPDQNSDKKQL